MKRMLQCLNFKKDFYCIFVLILIFILAIYLWPKFFIMAGDILNKYSEGIIALSAIFGVIFGSSWLDTSKKKMKGKLDYDIARKYLKGILKLRDAVKIVRNPFIPTEETMSALKRDGIEYNESSEIDKNRSVYSARWNRVQEAWTNLEEILTEAEISWGEEAVKIQQDLDKLIRELRSIIWLFVNYPESFYKKSEENRKVIYGTHDENDEFAKKINTEIEKIRIFLKKYL